MKTADLIPFILLELQDCDKYGFELTKAIENKSKGKILIKQPTLYTLLKKLEKSKFIKSYWKDSDIGGKRHYYQLTENGRLQVSTFQSYEILLQHALNDESDNQIDSTENINFETVNDKKSVMLDDLLPAQPTESILPTEEVFASENIDNSTELTINASNADILKNDKDVTDEHFANNENVIKFKEKLDSTTQSINLNNNLLNKSDDILNVEFNIPKTEMEIKYVDYEDFKNNENYKYSKALSSKMLLQSLLTSASCVLMIILCSIFSSFSGRSVLYHVFFIASIIFAIFYPIIVGFNVDKIRIKYQNMVYDNKFKLRLYFGLSLTLLVLIICVVVNLNVGNNTIISILSFKNFENLYAPLLFSSIYFIDLFIQQSLIKKIKK